jgi:putative ABC transport system ATP-binding protein
MNDMACQGALTAEHSQIVFGPLPCRSFTHRELIVPEFVVERVSKGFWSGGDWLPVLDNVSLELEPGEVGAIVGRRLGGKTTLLRIAAGMQRPDEGTVSLGDQELTGLSDRRISRLRGRTIMWVNRDGADNDLEVSRFVGYPIAIHGRKQADRIAAQALERVGARDCAGRKLASLSTWQRMLVGFAQAFAGSPRLVVIDDLLDVLGRRHTQAASDLLRSLMDASDPRPLVLMGASDIDSALFADRTWRLTRKGTLSEWTGKRSEGNVLPFPQADGA